MRIFVFPLQESDLSKFTEIFTIVPILPEKNYNQVINFASTWNEGLYAKLRFSISPFKYVNNLNECDVAIIPFKYSKIDRRIDEYCSLCREYNKNVICFLNDDTSEIFDLPDNLFLFRTSLYKSQQQQKERCFPVLIADHLPNTTILTSCKENNTITFCGHAENNRRAILEEIANNYDDTNFIIRAGFLAPEITSRQECRRDFYTNLISGSYTFCMKGNGNFSYRFYEALSFGRIPILIDTDCLLPFENIIDWSKHVIKIKENEISNLPSLIQHDKISPLENRQLWQRYFSPEGYYTNFLKDI